MSLHKNILTKYLREKGIHVEPDWELVHVKRICKEHNINSAKVITNHQNSRKENNYAKKKKKRY